jgi:hypothetical protein
VVALAPAPPEAGDVAPPFPAASFVVVDSPPHPTGPQRLAKKSAPIEASVILMKEVSHE